MDSKEIGWIAQLARLEIPPGDVRTLGDQLTRILAFVEQMNTVDTINVAPLAHPLDLAARLRADEVTEVPDRDTYQSAAPRVKDGYYLVPRVIE
jgi:aspartyl-tRNA(Asn)/glutamyl-tRNA(Gln) amidotransferase subunit C